MGLDISYKSVKFSCNHFRIDQNTPFLPPPPHPLKNFVHYHCFQSLVGITAVPKETKNNGYEKKGGRKCIVVYVKSVYWISDLFITWSKFSDLAIHKLFLFPFEAFSHLRDAAEFGIHLARCKCKLHHWKVNLWLLDSRLSIKTRNTLSIHFWTAVHWESRYASGHTFYRHNHVRITIDIGATGNMIRLSTVRKLKIKIC